MTPQKPWHLRAAEEFAHSAGPAWKVEHFVNQNEHTATRAVNEKRGVRLLFHGHDPHTANVLLKKRDSRGEFHPVLKIESDMAISHSSHFAGRVHAHEYGDYVYWLTHAQKFLARHVPKRRQD